MIKKSVFEEELILGMQREMQSHEKKAGMNSLVKAADYLNSAVEIFEEAGMTAKADQVLRILGKIALAGQDSRVRAMPSFQKLMEAGVTHNDLKNTNDPTSRARVNTAMRVLGYTDREIKHFLGDKFMSETDAHDILDPERPYGGISDWFKDPLNPIGPGDVVDKKPEISFQSLVEPEAPKPGGQFFDIKSVAGAEDNDQSWAEDLLNLDLEESAVELGEDTPEDKTFEDSD